MNFFHNQIIKNHAQARLFGVADDRTAYPAKDPRAHVEKYKRYVDHEVALHDRIYHLVEDAFDENENPKALIEDFLGVPYSGGDTTEEIANFLCNTHHMVHALGILKENWNYLDESAPADSLVYASSEIDETIAFGIYLETSFRNYLETLSQIYHG
jgi:hypothetical protein